MRGCCLRLIGWAGGDTDLRSMGFEGEKQIAEVENTQEGKKKENSLAWDPDKLPRDEPLSWGLDKGFKERRGKKGMFQMGRKEQGR